MVCNKSKIVLAVVCVLVGREVLLSQAPPERAAIAFPDQHPQFDAGRKTDLIASLQETIETKHFQQPMVLSEGLKLIYEQFAAKNKEFPLVINRLAFIEEAGTDYQVGDDFVTLPDVPHRLSVHTALDLILSHIKSRNATFVIHRDYIEITTKGDAAIDSRLSKAVFAEYRKEPLVNVVADLSDRFGVTIILDPRDKKAVETPISATFRHDVSLGSALDMLAEMASLKVVVMEQGVFLTQPTRAIEMQKEQDKKRKASAPVAVPVAQ